MSEQRIQQEIRLALSQGDTRVFRQNVGTGWTGDVTRLRDGSILIKNPRPLHAGLCRGSSDLIGWTRKTITEDMVGQPVAVFTAVEVKAPKGKISAEQKNFLERVAEAGGLAGVARSVAEAQRIIDTKNK